MKKPQLQTRHDPSPYRSYVVGFGLSILTTLVAYFFVVNKLFSPDVLVYVIMGIAVIQLVVQMVFFLHIGRGSRWKFATFLFTLLVVVIVGIGTLWVMHNMNYNMMDMTPEQQHQYMKEHEGI